MQKYFSKMENHWNLIILSIFILVSNSAGKTFISNYFFAFSWIVTKLILLYNDIKCAYWPKKFKYAYWPKNSTTHIDQKNSNTKVTSTKSQSVTQLEEPACFQLIVPRARQLQGNVLNSQPPLNVVCHVRIKFLLFLYHVIIFFILFLILPYTFPIYF